MVGLSGLEPPTSPLSGVRSNHLSYRPKLLRGIRVMACGARGQAPHRRVAFLDAGVLVREPWEEE